MQVNKTAVLAMVSVAMIGTVLSSPLAAQGGGKATAAPGGKANAAQMGSKGAPPKTHIIEQAPTDHAIAIPTEKLADYYKQMDAAHEETLRMVEGGHFNVNIRRIKTPESEPLIHPKTIDLWYVLEGSGSVTTGGKFVDGKVTNGVTDHLKPGDVEFIPANIPHWMSEVGSDGITWLNVRWDVDWKGPMGAGNAPIPGERGGPNVGQFATADKAVYIPKEMLNTYIAEQNSQKSTSQTERMIEGGHFNINIRNITEPSIEFHKNTIDTWVILQGSGTANTGFNTSAGDAHTEPGRGATRVAGTGVDAPAKVGDVFFVPSDFTHGFSAVNGRMVWLNIRYDSDY